MGNMLASDVNNPDFAGATNPDSRLAVVFFKKAMPNEFKTAQEGRPIFEDCDFVRIMVPGDSDSIVETFAREDHKKRFPLHWAHFLNQIAGEATQIGTPLEEWSILSKAQVEELRAQKFFTIDNIAGASDQNLQKIGMMAGMSPYIFRDKAAAFLKFAQDSSVAIKSAEEAAKLREENAQLKADTASQLQAMRDEIAKLTQRKKPGPKPKVLTE